MGYKSQVVFATTIEQMATIRLTTPAIAPLLDCADEKTTRTQMGDKQILV